VRPGDPVEKEFSGAVVDFMLQRAGLERVSRQAHLLARTGQNRLDHDAPGAAHIAGQIRHRHAALAAGPPPARLGDLGIAQHERAVRGHRLGMLGDVHDEHLRADADLRRGQAHAARRHPHGGDQVGGQPHDLRIGRVDLGAGPTQDSRWCGDHRPDGAVDPERLRFPVEVLGHRTSDSARRSVTST
jgi:hypothetical protein